jgi:AcrR family transcriptional regulator
MRQAERRAQTTRRLLDAAAEVFAQRGFHAATVDDIADAAGYTKGAVYANFTGKDALFLALLDRHLDDQVAQVDRIVAAASETDLRAELRDASAEQLTNGGSFGLLTLEFWLYAARDTAARDALTARYRRMRDRLAEVIAERGAAPGTTDPRSPHELAALILALDAGLFLQHLIDPDAITPELRADALAALIDPPRNA